MSTPDAKHLRRFDLERFSAEELPREEHAQVVAHLEVCPECQSYVDELELEQKTLLALTSANAFADRVIDGRQPLAPKPGVVGRWIGFAGLGVVAAGLLFFVAPTFWPSKSSQPQAEQWQVRGKPSVKVILRRHGELRQLRADDPVLPGDGLRLEITPPTEKPMYAVVFAMPASAQHTFVLSPGGSQAFAIHGQTLLPGSIEVDADPNPVLLVLIVRPERFVSDGVLHEIEARRVGSSPESWDLSGIDGVVWTRVIVPKSP